ncbi:MAG: CinA family protein [Proteobacteria bacterium]|nr:CinA family protein [Pseudomonadota bacterium]
MTAPTDVDLQRLAGSLGDRLLARSATLVTAESCTGGWIAKACTDVAGSSRWFQGGVVACSNDLKAAFLGVPEDLLTRHGAVSRPVVSAMAAGVLARTGSDVAVAVSGVAGPDGGTADKPVGTVWLAWAWREQDGSLRTETRRERFPGGRDEVRRRTVRCALERLLAE